MNKVQFTCLREILLDAAIKCSRAVSVKSNLAALQGILCQAEKTSLYLTAYDLELGIKTSIDVNCAIEGSIVIPAKIFADILRRMTGEMVTVSVDEKNTATIKCGDTESSVSCIDASEFPEFPNVNKEKSLNLKAETFKSMVRQTIFCTAQNDIRPIHTGVCFDIKPNELTLIALDGFRLASRKESISIDDTMKFIVPGKALNEIVKLISDDEDIIEISVGRRHIIFTFENYYVITRLLDGEFMDFRSSISMDFTTKVIINTKNFRNSVELASLIISERIKTPVRCFFSNNECVVKCTTEVGRMYDKIDCNIEGSEVEIGINNRYLLDALSASELDLVSVEMNGPLSPVKIRPVEGDDFLFIIMPMRLKNEI